MTLEEFDACFDQFHHDVFRLETLQVYAVDEDDESYAAWRSGRPRPECSVRTSPWMRRIALSTAEGKAWSRVHVVDEPLSDYLRYELIGYIEQVVVGEEVRITPRHTRPELAELHEDFYLFDADWPQWSFAVVMAYDSAGHWLGADRTTDPALLERYRSQRKLALAASMPLNEYLVRFGGALRQVA